MERRIRVVGLHGRSQTGEVFLTRIGPLVSRLGARFEWSFPDGPVELAKQEGDAVARRAWYASESDSDVAIADRRDGLKLDTKMPVECAKAQVLVGFSQGGLLAIAAGLKNLSVRLIVAAGAPDSPAVDEFLKVYSKTAGERYLRVILYAGEADLIVKPASTKQLYERLKAKGIDCELRMFEGNHYFPASSKHLSEINQEALEWQLKAGASESVQTQQEELEVLKSIYGDSLIELNPAPTSPSDPCLKVAIELDAFPNQKSKPRLIVTARSGYPIETDVQVSIEGAVCNRKAFEKTLSESIQSLHGEMQFFACISAVQENLGEIQNITEENAAQTVKEDMDEAPEEDLDEEQTLELITQLTEEARTKIISAHALISEDTRAGHWSFCIGLIGKPSCGKSTLFNAITQNALLGKTEAEEGAQPFTTIDPNLGIVRCQVTPTLNLKVTLKDVAGLVPGAYRGLGKGNRFLNDLLDADALIHVCDSTGTADDGGRVATETPSPQQVARDALWVLREVHLWIYGNVTAKWPQYKKGKGPGERTEQAVSYSNRVCQLFAGYHAPPSMILRAAKLANLDLERAPGFSVEQRHKLCAYFIAVRFPVVLALNKVDFYHDNKLNLSMLEDVVKESIRTMGDASLVAKVSAKTEKSILELVKKSAIRYAADTGKIEHVADPPSADVIKVLESIKTMGGSTGVHDALIKAIYVARPLMVEALVDKERKTFLMYPGSTVYDLYEACTRNKFAAGDFVRAEEVIDVNGAGGRSLSRDAPLSKHLRVRIATNKKVVHQHKAPV